MKIENVGSYLKEHGIKPSLQRIKIFQYLIDNYNHPTVDTIYKALIDEIPTLSKTTVYNTLNTFVDSSIVNILVIEENEARYDVNISTHGHFKCKKCGKIHDFDINLHELGLEEMGMHSIDETHVYLKGICQMCVSQA